MRTLFFLLLAASAVLAEDLPITRLAGATLKVSDLEKTRQFYTGLIGLEEAFDLKDSSGAIQSVFFKVNDEQYIEVSPGAADGFQLEHVSILAPDLKKLGAELQKRGVTPGKIGKSATGNSFFVVKDPDKTEIDFVRYMPGSKETEYRGKALGARRVSDHLHHVGVASDDEPSASSFYKEKLGLHEFLRGPTQAETRWIILMTPGDTGDFIESMVMKAQPAQGRRHIGFEVPNMQAAYKMLLDHGLPANVKPFPGQSINHRWFLNLKDPNGLRVEFTGEQVVDKAN